MAEPAKEPWGVLIITLIVSAIGWMIVRSGALEATSAPQNLILVLSELCTAASALGLLILVVARFRKPRA